VITEVHIRSTRPRAKHWGRKNLRNIALVLPVITALALFAFRPLLILVVESGRPPTGRWTTNYRDLVSVPALRASLIHTLVLAVASTAGALVIGTSASLALQDVPSRWLKRLIQTVVAFPLSFPGVIVGFLVIMIFGRAGALPKLIEAATGERRLAIAYSPIGLSLAYCYFQVPRVIGTLSSAIGSLDHEVQSAARTLGANARRVRWSVTIPQIVPQLISAAGLSLATSIGAYGTVATLSQGYRVLPLDLADAVTNEFRRDRAGAIAVVLTVTAASLFMLCTYLSRKLSNATRAL
jgi:putative spermidine/putrescine transport system permease protein